MAKKLAIFVEGQTEQIFLKRLLQEIAGSKNIHFQEERWHGKQFLQLQSHHPNGAENYFALIIDCCSDGAVKSALIQRHSGLVAAGYQMILGIRDLYPFPIADLQKLMRGMAVGLPTGLPKTEIIIAIMEVEAWFAQEEYHYQNLSNILTKEFIKSNFNFDVVNDCAEILSHPASFLNDVYKSAGMVYDKTNKRVSRTVNAINYENMYCYVPGRLPSFKQLVDRIDEFLT